MIDREQLLRSIASTCQQCRDDPPARHRETISSGSAHLLLQALGFAIENINSQFRCDNTERVDYGARFQPLQGAKSFNVSPSDPDLIVEVKPPNHLFTPIHKDTLEVVAQLQRYLRSKPCKTARYGLIFNGCELQLFRKHAALVYPITPILSVAGDQIDATLKQLEERMQPAHRSTGTIITVWNNKGGVGKTTTAQNLALLLSNRTNREGEKNKILIIDFDHNQGDLTANFGLEPSDGSTYQLLESMLLDGPGDGQIASCIRNFGIPKGLGRQRHSLDVLTADCRLNTTTNDYRQTFMSGGPHPLRKLCKRLAQVYDYVVIDAPPQLRKQHLCPRSCHGS